MLIADELVHLAKMINGIMFVLICADLNVRETWFLKCILFLWLLEIFLATSSVLGIVWDISKIIKLCNKNVVSISMSYVFNVQ